MSMPPGQFSGDMDRNEVEIDLSKFMALLQEKAELKDRIRELEDVSNVNPFQKWIFLIEESMLESCDVIFLWTILSIFLNSSMFFL